MPQQKPYSCRLTFWLNPSHCITSTWSFVFVLCTDVKGSWPETSNRLQHYRHYWQNSIWRMSTFFFNWKPIKVCVLYHLPKKSNINSYHFQYFETPDCMHQCEELNICITKLAGFQQTQCYINLAPRAAVTDFKRSIMTVECACSLMRSA